jgi:hypothetical protein
MALSVRLVSESVTPEARDINPLFLGFTLLRRNLICCSKY